jgi:hypothetical protein
MTTPAIGNNHKPTQTNLSGGSHLASLNIHPQNDGFDRFKTDDNPSGSVWGVKPQASTC